MSPEPQPDDRGGEQLSSVFDMLASGRRRFLLCLLSRAGGDEPLSNVIASAEEWQGRHTERARDRLQKQLYHVDLPKLEHAGLIAIDDNVVRLTELGERAELVRRAATEAFRDRRW